MAEGSSSNRAGGRQDGDAQVPSPRHSSSSSRSTSSSATASELPQCEKKTTNGAALSNTPTVDTAPPLPSPGLQLSQQSRLSYFTPVRPRQTARTTRQPASRVPPSRLPSRLPSRIPSAIRSTTSQRPQTLNRGPTQRDWVDKEYLDENPWYGIARQKPVFSLGQPLPHTARRRHTEKRTTGKAGDPDVEAAETATTPEHEASQQDDQAVPHLFQDTNRFALDAEPLGYREREEVEEGFRDPDELRNWWASFRARHPELLAEFLATTVSIFLGIAGTLTVNLSADPSTIYGTFEAAWSSGFAWMLGIYIGGGVSGAHMNPAVSVSLSVFRRFPWRQCAAYVLVQLLAAAAAGSLAYAVFRDAIRNADGPARETAWMAFCATRREWMSTGGAALSQVVQSAVMMIMVFALGDDQNDPPGAGMHAFILGLLVTTLKLTLGHNTGSALNPAADFGPRLVMLGVGYGRSVVFGNAWWVIGPWAANLAGALLGGIVYDGFIFVGSESPVNRRIKLSR